MLPKEYAGEGYRHNYSKPIVFGKSVIICDCTSESTDLKSNDWYECRFCFTIHNFGCYQNRITNWNQYQEKRAQSNNLICSNCQIAQLIEEEIKQSS